VLENVVVEDDGATRILDLRNEDELVAVLYW